MGIITTEGYARGFLPSMGYGGHFETPDPPITERMPNGIQIPAPQHKTPESEYTYETTARGHRDKEYSILTNGYKELQKRYRQSDFIILESFQNVFKGFHEPGAQFKFSDLLTYYPFDGDATERLKDKSGNGKDFVLAGSPNPTFIAGQSGNAIFFPFTGGGKAFYDGSVFPSNDTGFSSMSLTFWLAIAPLVDDEGEPVERTLNALLFRHHNPTQFFDVHLTPDRRIRVSLYDLSGNTLTWFSETPILTKSFFQHVTITYRKSYLNSSLDLGIPIISLYVDKSPKLISLYESDADAPRELLYGGDTTLGQDSGCVMDEFRVYGHDLDQSEVTTDFNYKANRVQFDNFQRSVFSSDMWASVGVTPPYMLEDRYVILPEGTSIVSNHLLRSKLWERVTKFYVNATDWLGLSGNGGVTLIANLKDGDSFVKVSVVVYKSGTTINIESVTIEEQGIDGQPTPDPLVLPWNYLDIGEGEFIITLWQAREDKNISLSIGLEQLSHPNGGMTTPVQSTLLVNKTFIGATRVTGDYAFVSEYSILHHLWSSVDGLSEYEARNTTSSIIYTPVEIVVTPFVREEDYYDDVSVLGASSNDLFTPEDGETGTITLEGEISNPSWGYPVLDAFNLAHYGAATEYSATFTPLLTRVFDYTRVGGVVTITPQTLNPTFSQIYVDGLMIKIRNLEVFTPTVNDWWLIPTPYPLIPPFVETSHTYNRVNYHVHASGHAIV